MDTSALAKRYLNEVGSTWLSTWIEPAAGHEIIVARLAETELFTLLARRQREGTLTAADAARLEADFLYHGEAEYFVVPLTDAVFDLARQLVQRHPLRTLDAIQLASALQVAQTLSEPLTFVTADRRLLVIAASEGFATENPSGHP